MTEPLKETIYTPDSQLRKPGLLAKEMIADLIASRELAWRLFIRNISAMYRQSILGYLWAFLPPLLTMLVWVFLNSQKIINVADTDLPYPVFVLTGTVLWQTFVDSINSPIKIVTQSKSMLAKINFPREALILAGIGEVIFNFLIRVILLIGVFIWFQVAIPPTIPFAILGVISLIALGLMFGILLTPLGILYTDVGLGIIMLTQLWFFLTPIIYPMPEKGIALFLAKLNPVTPVLVTTREWLTQGSSIQLPGFLIVMSFVLIFLVIGWVLYRIAMPHLIARMSA